MAENLKQLDPNDILIRDNVRFTLKPYRIESLAEDILKSSGVRTPITVEKLKEAVDGKNYALLVGGYRTAAVEKLNRESKAGLTLPAMVVPEMTEAERLLAQVSENNERENMSPMDKAIAIQKMESAGVPKVEIRKSFSTPGGRKGIKVQMASNSHINMLKSFLAFPKPIQNKIHDGTLGVLAAYKLTKLPRDKWDDILEAAETDRIKTIKAEEDEEERYLRQSKKAEEAEQEATKALTELEQAQKLAKDTAESLDKAVDAVAEAHKAKLTASKADAKKAEESYKAADALRKSARQAKEDADKELAKLQDKQTTLSEKAQAARERLEAARKAKADKVQSKATAPAKAKTITASDVDKAARKAGANKSVKLNGAEMREAVTSLIKLSTPNKHSKTIKVGELILECFDSKITDGTLQLAIARLFGEEPMPKAAAKK